MLVKEIGIDDLLEFIERGYENTKGEPINILARSGVPMDEFDEVEKLISKTIRREMDKHSWYICLKLNSAPQHSEVVPDLISHLTPTPFSRMALI